MPAYVSLFFAARDPRSTVVERVSEATGAGFDPVHEPFADYLGQRDDLVFDLKFGHDFEDDAGIPFERMPIVFPVDKDFGMIAGVTGQALERLPVPAPIPPARWRRATRHEAIWPRRQAPARRCSTSMWL